MPSVESQIKTNLSMIEKWIMSSGWKIKIMDASLKFLPLKMQFKRKQQTFLTTYASYMRWAFPHVLIISLNNPIISAIFQL